MKYYFLLFIIISIRIVHPITDNSLNRNNDFNDYLHARSDYKKDTNTTDTSFQYFWEYFRISIISQDSVSLIDMINFPLLASGYQDSDPQYSIPENNFMKFIDIFLGLGDINMCNKDQIEQYKKNMLYITSTYNVTVCRFCAHTKTWRRMGDMEFIFINDQWKLSKMYMDTNFLYGIH